ncbi:RhoGAP domain-containing protein, partial [Staphylococcus aureus]|uniref:RhoGAP domain-containing protein n=1 Tax=Staphylococcus aureus TaxID=1280 RepID=UPI0038B41428
KVEPATKIFGKPLDHVMRVSQNFVPEFIFEITEAIEKDGKEIVGLYRMSGEEAKINALIEMVDLATFVSFKDPEDVDEIHNFA